MVPLPLVPVVINWHGISVDLHRPGNGCTSDLRAWADCLRLERLHIALVPCGSAVNQPDSSRCARVLLVVWYWSCGCSDLVFSTGNARCSLGYTGVQYGSVVDCCAGLAPLCDYRATDTPMVFQNGITRRLSTPHRRKLPSNSSCNLSFSDGSLHVDAYDPATPGIPGAGRDVIFRRHQNEYLVDWGDCGGWFDRAVRNIGSNDRSVNPMEDDSFFHPNPGIRCGYTDSCIRYIWGMEIANRRPGRLLCMRLCVSAAAPPMVDRDSWSASVFGVHNALCHLQQECCPFIGSHRLGNSKENLFRSGQRPHGISSGRGG